MDDNGFDASEFIIYNLRFGVLVRTGILSRIKILVLLKNQV